MNQENRTPLWALAEKEQTYLLENFRKLTKEEQSSVLNDMHSMGFNRYFYYGEADGTKNAIPSHVGRTTPCDCKGIDPSYRAFLEAKKAKE